MTELNDGPPGLRLAIGIPTRRRPEELVRAVGSLASQNHNHLQPPLIIIADNDRDESARKVVAMLSKEFAGKLEVCYAPEPTEGYSSVRNRILTEALEARVDALWMMDDDEIADGRWMSAGIDCSEVYHCDVVVGPCDYVFDHEGPQGSSAVLTCAWTAPSTTRQLPTGTRLDVTSAHNLMLRLDRLRNRDIRFRESYNRSGGEDTEWSLRLARQGTLIVWCEEARVTEVVPRHRTEIKWLQRRAWRNGVNLYRATKDVQGQKPIGLVLKATIGMLTLVPIAAGKAFFNRRCVEWWRVEGRSIRHMGIVCTFLRDIFPGPTTT